MFTSNNLQFSDRAFDITVNHVTDANNKSIDFNVKKLQRYLKKHNGRSSEDFFKENSYFISLLFTKSDFNNKNVMDATIISHDNLQYGHNINILRNHSNTFNKIANGIYSNNKYNNSGITAKLFALAMNDTFTEIISKIQKVPNKFYTTYKNISYQMVDSLEESGKLTDNFNTKFLISNVSINGKQHILLAGCVTNPAPVNNLITRINNKEVIETSYPIAVADSDIIYKISLPSNEILDNSIIIPEYVYTIQINGSFTQFELDTTNVNDNVTNDIENASSYFFNTHFTYDTTWTPRIIPTMTELSPYQVKCHKMTNITQSPERVSVSLFTKPNKYDYIYLKLTIIPKTYVVGTLKIIFGDIYPTKLTNYYDNFEITISVE